MICIQSGIGIGTISEKLLELNIKPKRSELWAKSTITRILTNPVYIGKIRYEDKETTKKMIDGKIARVKNPNSELLLVDGIHEPIINIDVWNKVQNIRRNNLISCKKVDYSLRNPMGSILKCELCGRSMVRRLDVRNNEERIMCKFCKENVSTRMELVEEKLFESLSILLNEYKVMYKENDNSDIELAIQVCLDSINSLENEIQLITLQLNNAYDFFEQGVYDKDTFISRSEALKCKIAEIEESIKKTKSEKQQLEKGKSNKQVVIPKLEKVIDAYRTTQDISLKNALLKDVLSKVTYLKKNPKNQNDFTLTLYPKIFLS